MSKSDIIEQLLTLDNELAEFIRGLPKGPVFDDVRDAELRRFVNAISVNVTAVIDAIAVEVSPPLADYFSGLYKSAVGSITGNGHPWYSPTLIVSAFERLRKCVFQIKDKVQGETGSTAAKGAKPDATAQRRKRLPRTEMTPRENQVDELLGRRWTNAQIAVELGISEGRVSQLKNSGAKYKTGQSRSVSLRKTVILDEDRDS